MRTVYATRGTALVDGFTPARTGAWVPARGMAGPASTPYGANLPPHGRPEDGHDRSGHVQARGWDLHGSRQ